RWLLTAAVSTIFLAATQMGHAAPPSFTVLDNAGFFSKKAIEDANEEVAAIKKQNGKDLLIETFKEPPARFDSIDKKEKSAVNQFFVKWGEDQVKSHRVEGIYVLICKAPSHLQVLVGQNTRQTGAFTNSNRDELAKLMIAKLHDKKPDEALHNGIAFVRKTL